MASGHATASNDLVWLLLKSGSNSFVVKRPNTGAPSFSTEKGNLTNLHSFKYSGLCNERTLHVAAAPSGRGVTLTSRNKNNSRFANGSATSSKNVNGGQRKAAGAIARQSGSDVGRLDLRSAAIARASAIIASQSKSIKSPRTRALRGKHAAVAASEE